jgi:hypothetical protein
MPVFEIGMGRRGAKGRFNNQAVKLDCLAFLGLHLRFFAWFEEETLFENPVVSWISVKKS